LCAQLRIFLQSKPNQLKDLSTGQPSLLLPSQESLGAPAPEQVPHKLVLSGHAFVHRIGLICYVRLPVKCTRLSAQEAASLQTKCTMVIALDDKCSRLQDVSANM